MKKTIIALATLSPLAWAGVAAAQGVTFDDIDADGSQTLTVDEIEGYLLAAQTARDPQSTSLGLKPKKPFYTAEGARGL